MNRATGVNVTPAVEQWPAWGSMGGEPRSVDLLPAVTRSAPVACAHLTSTIGTA